MSALAPNLPDITVRQLEYLAAVSTTPTWADAARSLGVSPSALSQGIAELERRLGLALFRAEGRRKVATDSAEPVIAHARRVLAQTADLAGWAEQLRTGRRGRLRVGMIDAAAVGHHPEALREFRRRHSDVELHLAVAPSASLVEQLRDGALDIVVCVEREDWRERGPDPDLAVTPLLEESLAVYGPQTSAAGTRARRRDGPSGWGPWVLFPAGSHTRALVTSALATAGARVDVVAESHQPEVLREMVRLGMGWTVLPTVQAEPAHDPLRRARTRPLTTRALVAVRRADSLHDAAADSLLQLLVAGA